MAKERQTLTLTQERILRAFERLATRDGRRLRSITEVKIESGLGLTASRRNLKVLVKAGFLREYNCGAGRAHGLRYELHL